MAAANGDLAPYERVVNFAVLERDFELERDELTHDNRGIDVFTLPEATSHEESPNIRLPYFITEEFFAALKARVMATFDERVAAADWL